MAGTAAALGATALFLATDERLYLAIAYSGYFLNLFNLVPISPLDGGRVAKMFSRRMWILGLALLAGLALVHVSVPLIIIGIFALMHSLRPQPPGPDEAEVSPRDRVNMAANYFGLAAFLAVGMYFAGVLLHRN
jgi:Zn-dependent protease